MGQLKKIKGLIDSFEKLPDGSFKKAVGDDVEKIKEWENLDKVKKLNEALDNVDESTNVDDTVVETSVTETTEGTADEL